jgi:hypothetical protein
LRPANFPRGAAAMRRQPGVESSPRLTLNLNARMTKTAKGGDIWPAEIKDISLPHVKKTSVELSGVREDVKMSRTAATVKDGPRLVALVRLSLPEGGGVCRTLVTK